MGDAFLIQNIKGGSPLGTQENPAATVQALADAGISEAGVYWVTIPNHGPKQVYCEFKNNEGWMLVGNIKSFYAADTNWTWNDITSWRRTGNTYGNIEAPYTTAGHYRDGVAYSNYAAQKVMIKMHNNGNEFGSGSWVAFALTPTHTNKTFLQLMTSGGGSGGGLQISNAWYAQQGMATSGSLGNTTGFASGLDYCPITRSLGASGHLRVNHHLSNNAARLLTSFQVLETSNLDVTRGFGCAYGYDGSIEGFESTWNTNVSPYVNATSNSSSRGDNGNFQHIYRNFGTAAFPDNSNSSARTTPSPYNGTPYHYGLFVK